jgi:DNA-directed RNA polymerase specialized sigma24 family protein
MMQPEFLDVLLEALGETREDAGIAYREIHERLARFFRLNNGSDPQTLADEVMDRLAKRTVNTPKEKIASPRAFALGIARHLLQEDQRRQTRETKVARDWDVFSGATESDREQLLKALEECMNRMSEDKRKLLLAYYSWQEGKKIDHHRVLADRLGLTMNALRNRMMRARSELDTCVRNRQRDVSQKKDIAKRRIMGGF